MKMKCNLPIFLSGIWWKSSTGAGKDGRAQRLLGRTPGQAIEERMPTFKKRVEYRRRVLQAFLSFFRRLFLLFGRFFFVIEG